MRKKLLNFLVKTWSYVIINRKSVTLSLLSLTILLVACHLLYRHFASPPRYTVHSLGVHGLLMEVKVVINNHGDVAGTVLVAPQWPHPPIHNMAFLDQGGKITSLGALPGGSDSTAVAINDRNEVVGICTFPNGASRAFFWRRGRMTDLGIDSQRNYSLNNNGQIISSIDY